MALPPMLIKKIEAVAITAGTPVVIWTPTAGKKFRLVGYTLGVSAQSEVIFKEGAAHTIVCRTPNLPAVGQTTVTQIGEGILSAAANNVLEIDANANTTVKGFVWGYEE